MTNEEIKIRLFEIEAKLVDGRYFYHILLLKRERLMLLCAMKCNVERDRYIEKADIVKDIYEEAIC